MPTHHSEEVPDTPLASVMRANGAYLIHWIYPGTDDMTDDELYDAASSLAKAKRIARRDLPDDIKGPYRWREEHGMWWLHGTYTEEYDTHEEEYR